MGIRGSQGQVIDIIPGLSDGTSSPPGSAILTLDRSSLAWTAQFWSADGNTLYYAAGRGGGVYSFFAARLQRDPVPAVLSTNSLFTGTYGQPLSGAGLNPDGRRWILSKAVAAAPAGSKPSIRLVLVEGLFEELKRLASN